MSRQQNMTPNCVVPQRMATVVVVDREAFCSFGQMACHRSHFNGRGNKSNARLVVMLFRYIDSLYRLASKWREKLEYSGLLRG